MPKHGLPFRLTFARLALLAGLTLLPSVIPAADWPAWRGPNNDGVSRETGVVASAHEVLWRVPIPCRSTPVILDGRVFLISLAGEGVMALDLETGATLWEHRFNVFHTDVPNTRVGWANVVADPETGYVYAHGVQGLLFCFDRDGKVVWSRSLTETAGRISGYGGRTQTPIIDEDRLVISFVNSSYGSQAQGAHRYLALDKRTGEMLWWSTPGGRPEDTTYSVPAVAVVNGRRLLIGGNADGGVYAVKARTGEKVWGTLFSQRGLNSSVVVDGWRVYASHSEESHDSTALGRVAAFDARGSGDVTKTHELWRHDGVEAGYATPLLHNGRLYVMTNFGVLICYEAESGKPVWHYNVGRVGKGSPVWADGRIYVAPVNGSFTILQDMGAEAKLVDALPIESDAAGEVEMFGSPAVSQGRVVFSTTRETICLGRKDASVTDSPPPPLPPEAPADPAAGPATILVRPCEVLLKPGESIEFKAVAFDKNGRQLKEAAAQWSSDVPGGSVGGEGRFQAAAGPHGAIGEVAARFGALSATARVRVVPELPLAEDFDAYNDGDVVGWWVGVTKGKYAIETQGGSKVLKKIADDRGPIFNRSLGFITPPLAAGYTVEADVMGAKQGRKRGDVGLVNARYNVELMGATQRLRVMSWVPGPRFEKRIDFKWQPDTWYRVKFRVEPRGGEAHLFAKVWPRGEAEPQAWTIEAVDPQPNIEGAAGIYAYSLAPLYFDNVKVER